MKFKNYEDYKTQRASLCNAADELLQNGDVEGANAKMAEVEQLDNEYEAFATAQANLAAMQGRNTPHENGVIGSMGNTAEKDMFDTDEYKNAFMNLVCRGEAMPGKYKDAIAGKLKNAVTTVTETTAVIPTSTMKEFIRELKVHGELYARVRKTNVQGGVEIPILSLCPTANWVADGSASTDQKVTANTKVSFSYYGLECKIAQSLIANVVDFAEFTEMFVPLAVEAIITALDKGIISGTGSGQMLGITKDSRVPAANVIEMTEADVASWKAWKEKVFAKMKKAYRNGVFVFAQGTFDAQIDGMVDSTGQPIARVNYGIAADGETYRFGGKEVITTEEDVLESFAAASSGEVFGVFVNLNNYIINTNMQMRTDRWRDNDNNQEKVKVTLVCDGKLADPNGVLILKKKSNSVNGGTYDKRAESENHSDITVTVAEDGQTITALLYNGAEVPKESGANWSVSGGTAVVLKKAYLAEFPVGIETFTAVTNTGTVSFTVEIVESEA